MKKIIAMILVATTVVTLSSCGFTSFGSSSFLSSDIDSQISSTPTSSYENSSEDSSDESSKIESNNSTVTSLESKDESSSKNETSSKDKTSSKENSSDDKSSNKPSSSDENSSKEDSSADSSDDSSASSKPDSSKDESQVDKDSFTPIDEKNYWCYKNITKTQKKIYNQLYDLVINHSYDYIEVENCEYNDLVIADNALRKDHPEIFWMSGVFYTSYNEKTAQYSMGYHDKKMGSGYICSADESKILAKALKKQVNAFLKKVSPEMTEYEIVLAAHDFIANKVSYDYEVVDDYDANPYSFTAYGALVNGMAVCEGYAKAFQLLMNAVGIDSMCVTGTYDGVGHMWNMVNIGGDWYNVDITFDDQTSLNHLFTNRTDRFMKNNKYVFDGEFSSSVQDGEGFNISRPQAIATVMSYYNVTGYFITPKSLENDSFYDAIETAIKNKRSSIEITISSKVDKETFDFDEYIEKFDFSSLGIKSFKVSKMSTNSVLYVLSWTK